MVKEMSSKIKLIVKRFLLYSRLRYRYYSSTKAFKKRYKNVDSSLFNKSLSEKVLNEYREKWGVFGLKVEVNTFLISYNLSGKIDYNIVPENIFAAIIEPSLNKYKDKELSFLLVKNVYEKYFCNKEVFPKCYFHKIEGVYYDSNFNIIMDVESFLDQCEFSFPIISKPSIGTADGVGVKVLNSLAEIKKSLNTYPSLVFQEKIQQSKVIDRVNPNMNSIRSCLYRCENGEFKILNNSIRFGVDGSLDNLKDGGVACYINDNGWLNEYAVKMYCEKYYSHPNSKVKFSDVSIPFYHDLIRVSESIANQIPLCNLVSLDMCLDNNNKWRCIEINLNSQTIRFAQYAGIGFFGEHTDEVIKKVLYNK